MGKIVAVPTGTIRKVLDHAKSVGTVGEVLDTAWAVRKAAQSFRFSLSGISSSIFTNLFDPKSFQRKEGFKQLGQSVDSLDDAITAFKKANGGNSSPPVNREPLLTAIVNVQSTVEVLSTFYPGDAAYDEAKLNFYDECQKWSHPIDNAIQGLKDLAPSLGSDWKRIQRWALILVGLIVGLLLLQLAIKVS